MIKTLAIITISIILASCGGEPVSKRAAKKVTEIGLNMLEGVVEAVDERGDNIGEKLTDATGKVAEGVGRSLDRQLDEHAAQVAAVAGRTLVQGMDGLDQGVVNEYYEAIAFEEELCSGVSLDYFGKIKSKAVIDAYFIILEKGGYSFKFDFYSDDCKTVILTKTTEVKEISQERKYTVVSFAFNSEEEALLQNAQCTKVTVTR